MEKEKMRVSSIFSFFNNFFKRRLSKGCCHFAKTLGMFNISVLLLKIVSLTRTCC